MLKKLIAVIMALAVMMGLCSVALAEGGTIMVVIDDGGDGTYNTLSMIAYRVFDAEDNNQGGYTYTTSKQDFINNATYSSIFTFTEAGSDGTNSVTLKDGKTATDIVTALSEDDALASHSMGEGVYGTFNRADSKTTVTFSNLEAGYYFIMEENNAIAPFMLTTLGENETVEITRKTAYPMLFVSPDTQTADYGQSVPLVLSVLVPESAGKPGFAVGDIKVHLDAFTNLSLSQNYTAENAPILTGGNITGTDTKCGIADNGLTFIIPESVAKANYGQMLDFTIFVTKGSENPSQYSVGTVDAVLRNQNFESSPVKASVFSHEIDIYKYDNGDPTKGLAGAKFILQYKSGMNENHPAGYYALTDTGDVVWQAEQASATKLETTEANGYMVRFEGLADGTYTLIEAEAPLGYTLMEPMDVTISGENVYLDVNNQNGGVLPSTGGIGTTLFYIVGAVLMLGAVIVFMTKRKVKQED